VIYELGRESRSRRAGTGLVFVATRPRNGKLDVRLMQSPRGLAALGVLVQSASTIAWLSACAGAIGRAAARAMLLVGPLARGRPRMVVADACAWRPACSIWPSCLAPGSCVAD